MWTSLVEQSAGEAVQGKSQVNDRYTTGVDRYMTGVNRYMTGVDRYMTGVDRYMTGK